MIKPKMKAAITIINPIAMNGAHILLAHRLHAGDLDPKLSGPKLDVLRRTLGYSCHVSPL